MSDIDRLNAVLDQEPWMTLRALADAHEEVGDSVLAAGYRWLAENKRAPEVVVEHYDERCIGQLGWYVNFADTDKPLVKRTVDRRPRYLPLKLDEAKGSVMGIKGTHTAYYEKVFRTPSAAYRAAAEAIGRLLVKEIKL